MIMESYYDIPLEDYDNTPYVSIEEMKELFQARNRNESRSAELHQDVKSGLYYSDCFVIEEKDMLYEHLMAEQCLEHLDKLDWKRITNGYDFNIVNRIQHLVENPLVWVEEIPNELAQQYVVTGRVAVEKSSEERSTCSPYNDLYILLCHERVDWFASKLPTCKDIHFYSRYYAVPKDMILWDIIMTDDTAELHLGKINPYTGREYWAYCNPTEFRRNIERIYNKFGAQKATQIVRLLRDDWKDIKAMKLFGVDQLSAEQIEEFRECIFEGMDRSLRTWDSEMPDTVEDEPCNQDPDGAFFAITDKMTYDMCKKELLRVINGAKTKAAACREILRSETVGYFVLSDKTDQEKAMAINPWVAHTNKKYVFTGDDFRKARNS